MACATPVIIKKPNGEHIKVPCGECECCRHDFLRKFGYRMEQEALIHERKGYLSSFVLFTYDDINLPLTGADIDTVQKRIKVMRQYIARGEYVYRYTHNGVDYKEHIPIPAHSPDWKYFLVAEYGESTHRIHYHAVFFGLPPSFAAFFRKVWPYGFVFTRPLKPGGCQYVLKYVEKCRGDYKEAYTSQGLNPPFRIMSKGIGMSFFETNFKEIQKNRGYYHNGRIETPDKYVIAKYGLHLSPSEKYAKKHELERLAKINGYDYADDWLEEMSKIKEARYVAKKRLEGAPVDDRLVAKNNKMLSETT